MSHPAFADIEKDTMPYFRPSPSIGAVTNPIRQERVSTYTLEHAESVVAPNLTQAWHANMLKSVWPSSWKEFVSGTSGAVISIDALPGALSVFAKLDALRTDDRLVTDIIARLRLSTAIRFNDRLADRIEQLLKAYKEDFDNRVFSTDSLRSLIDFLSATPALKYPTLTVTPGGELYASWKRGRECLFSIQFLDTREARFVIFRPNPRHAGHTDQFSGMTTIDTLMGAIAPYNVLNWASE